ncbi:MAG: DUF975 family protein [Lachnospiraceae bacterium]
MLVAKDFRAKAREALTGHWGVAVGTGFVAALLGVGTTSVGGGGGNSSGNSDQSAGGISNPLELIARADIPKEVYMLLVSLMAILATIAVAVLLVKIVVGGAATLGYVKFNLNLVDHKQASFGDLFSCFKRLLDGFLMQLLRTIYVVLWTLLFVIPGIIASYRYAMTPYILLENPGMTANEAITKSKELMQGNKWRLFCLQFSFIGWSILCVFTLGIGFLWLVPYMEAANAAFYREISAEKYGRVTEALEQGEQVETGYYN